MKERSATSSSLRLLGTDRSGRCTLFVSEAVQLVTMRFCKKRNASESVVTSSTTLTRGTGEREIGLLTVVAAADSTS